MAATWPGAAAEVLAVGLAGHECGHESHKAVAGSPCSLLGRSDDQMRKTMDDTLQLPRFFSSFILVKMCSFVFLFFIFHFVAGHFCSGPASVNG